MKEPHHIRKVGFSMIVVSASLAAIGILGLFIAGDVLFADNIQRQKTAIFEECWTNNDFQSPQCQKFAEARIFEDCMANLDLESPECYKYRTFVQSDIYEQCRGNRDMTSPLCQTYGNRVFQGIMEK